MSGSGSTIFDEEKFRRALPFEVRPTSTPGVFDIPLPPDFDPRTATAEECRRAGIRWRRSVANRNPIARALWDSTTARRYKPVEEAAFKSSPNLAIPARRRRPGPPNDSDDFWSGAVIEQSRWTAVIASWVVPTLSPGPQPAGTVNINGQSFTGWWLSSWVGLDGYLYAQGSSNDLLQIGIQQNIDTNGHQTTTAFYEWWQVNLSGPGKTPPANYPYVNNMPISGFDVQPGDTIVACASYISATAGHVMLLNHRNGNLFHKCLAPPPGADFNGGSVEWIVEDPGNGPQGGYPVADFTPVTFSSALACNCRQSLDNMNFDNPSSAAAPAKAFTLDMSIGGSVLTNATAGNAATTITFTG
jgi:hypothetical protein